uniref:Hr1 domain-containing protein n=4 Tax=Macrostomum lignano TaxID=282301 RepID=A0A1I8HXK3_9PLAT
MEQQQLQQQYQDCSYSSVTAKYKLHARSEPELLDRIVRDLENQKENLKEEMLRLRKLKVGAENLRNAMEKRRAAKEVNREIDTYERLLEEVQNKLAVNGAELLVLQHMRGCSQLPQAAAAGPAASPKSSSSQSATDGVGIEAHVAELQKQLAIEMKVKSGAERLLESLAAAAASTGGAVANSAAASSPDLVMQVRLELAQSRDKIAFLKNCLLRASQQQQQQQ